jgi:signal transduction histidine kinase
MEHDDPHDDPSDKRADGERWLGFADAPRLELDDALARVSDLARSVEGAQGRLRSLLRANAAITADLRLPIVLRQIAEAARDLVGAEYAALGVVGADGELDQFIHVGMPQDVVDRIGALPRGRGVLGMLVNDPEPIRLNDLTQHPAAAGFPVHHSPMGSFLGVPIRVGDRVFGNLYLTESKIGHFTKDDEQLVVALAGNAGVAIENARLYEKSERQRRWLDATAQVAQDLLAQQDGSPLDVVLRQALIASDADMASIVLKTADTGWTVVASVGAGADAPGTPVELETSLVGRAITGAAAVLVDERTERALPEPRRSDEISSAMAAPLLTSANAASGALSLTRLKDRPAFVEEDLQQLIGFTGSVGVAIELDQARRDRERAHLADDRARIAADLHDHVIQVLFATGMSLQNVVALISPSVAQSRVIESIDVLDDAIKQIRSTIFQLRAPITRPAALHHRLLKVVEEQSAGLGFEPAVTLSGIPHLVDRDQGLSDDIVAVTREALANVARHAMASRADLDVILDHSAVTVIVADDGQGIRNSLPISGLVNLRRRAEARAGHLRIEPRDGGGTRLVWTAQLHPDDA